MINILTGLGCIFFGLVCLLINKYSVHDPKRARGIELSTYNGFKFGAYFGFIFGIGLLIVEIFELAK